MLAAPISRTRLVARFRAAVVRIRSYAWKTAAALRVSSLKKQLEIPASRTSAALDGLRRCGATNLAAASRTVLKTVVVRRTLPQYASNDHVSRVPLTKRLQ